MRFAQKDHVTLQHGATLLLEHAAFIYLQLAME
jgi:hypothetical protein